jgi:Leu/Phe-tRNA-protein transferase
VLTDCQVYTKHLENLGAVMIPRKDFLAILRLHVQ